MEETMPDSKYDIAVVGLGAIGSATLMHLAKSGVRAIGIDQFSPPHDKGSSHGETRITRLSIGEGAEYIPLVRRSHELWRIIESETNSEILTITGGLILDDIEGASQHGIEGVAKTTAALAREFNIPHEVLSAKDAAARFPEFNIERDSLVYFEPGAGFIRPEAAIEAQLQIAVKHGAEIKNNQVVQKIEPTAQDTVKIRTSNGTIEAEKCLVSAGSWIKNFLPDEVKTYFKITRQVLHWLPIVAGSYPSPSSPIFVWCYGLYDEDMIYGFPSIDGNTIKVASECCTDSGTPEQVNRSVSIEEQNLFLRQKIGTRLKNIQGAPVRSTVCQYTVTPRSQFIIDYHPQMSNVLIASCCSGHGFKHSAALGEALAAKLQDNPCPLDLEPFQRFFR
jgi:sarcosine oxidase